MAESAIGAGPWLRREWRVALLLFVAGLVLYLPGIWWGLPYATAPDRIHPWGTDELAPLGPVAELYSVFVDPSPTFNPQYPLFHYVMQALLCAPYLAVLRLTGGLQHQSVEYPYGLVDPVAALATLTILARLVSVLMASGVVVAAAYTGSALWNRRTGIVAAALVLLMYPMFYYARTSNVDMGALFWTSLGLAVFARCLRDGLTVRSAAWLGTFAALATATKDPSYVIFAAAGLILLLRIMSQQRSPGSRRPNAWKAPLIGVVAGAAVYAVASGLIFSRERFLQHVQFIVHGSPQGKGIFYGRTPATIAGYADLLGDTMHYFVDSWGIPMTFFVAIGLALSLLRTPSRLAFAVPALGIPLAIVLPARNVEFRYVIPAAYTLAFFAAYALSELFEARSRGLRRIAPVAVALVCGWSLLRAADLTNQMIHDSRYELADWIRQHAAPDDRVAYFGSPLKLPPLEKHVRVEPAPWQTVYKEPPPMGSPDIILVIPQQWFETVHEWTLPDSIYRALNDGSLGYKPVLLLQTRSLFSRRAIPYVNPPVRVFARVGRHGNRNLRPSERQRTKWLN
ncbi:MAG: ArnT family glycosyltransferase [Gemmatimonadaceae bacterium]